MREDHAQAVHQVDPSFGAGLADNTRTNTTIAAEVSAGKRGGGLVFASSAVEATNKAVII
jgi:hypothetical protein